MKRFETDRRAKPALAALILFLLFAVFLVRAFWPDIRTAVTNGIHAVLVHLGLDDSTKLLISVFFLIALIVVLIHETHKDGEKFTRKMEEEDSDITKFIHRNRKK